MQGTGYTGQRRPRQRNAPMAALSIPAIPSDADNPTAATAYAKTGPEGDCP